MDIYGKFFMGENTMSGFLLSMLNSIFFSHDLRTLRRSRRRRRIAAQMPARYYDIQQPARTDRSTMNGFSSIQADMQRNEQLERASDERRRSSYVFHDNNAEMDEI